ncbi:MAG: helix-turn-helix transcriptional regulator [Lachnospiraceae bacterium]|nr:helix-turn-helix transcriptional regulator [Lachnospiraceae bacterium]
MAQNTYEVQNMPQIPENIAEELERSRHIQYTPVPVENFDFPVGAHLLDLANFSMRYIRWHWHEEVEFMIVHSGEALLKLPDADFSLLPGDGIFINQNRLHSIHSGSDTKCKLYSLKFNPAFLFGYGQTSFSSKYLVPILSSPSFHYLVLRRNDRTLLKMLALAKNVYDCCQKKTHGYELRARGYLCLLWEHLLPFVGSHSAQFPVIPSHIVTDSNRIKQAIHFIEQSYMDPLTLEDIAASIHVSKSECCRCFKRALGLTPFEYLMKYRIFESTKRIINGDESAKSISTLATSVGFNSSSYYNKLFKKYLKCTPTEYIHSLSNGATQSS